MDDTEDVLIKANQRLGTFLISQYKAPKWTKYELFIFKECLKKSGLDVVKLPSQAFLKIKGPYYLDLFDI